MRTEDLTFYHGTGASAARAILASGSRDSLFEEIGARTLGREIRRALLAHWTLSPGEEWRLHFLATGPGTEQSSLWVPALRQLDEPGNPSLVEYGHFFVTLNIGNAYNYAIGNPYRSEFILALAESLKVLENVGHELPRTVATRFPEIDRMIKDPSSPVVLELRGISRNRLLTERGDDDVDSDLQLFTLDFPSVNSPAAFRVRDVTAADVVAVHELCDWPSEEVSDPLWQPDPSRVCRARHSVRDWLAQR
jgi:hypothetical protein